MVLKPKDMATRLGVSVKTLQRWDNEGTLKAYGNPKNMRYYTEEQYLNYIGKPKKEIKINIAYTRVSKKYKKKVKEDNEL